ncbi:MAG: hypothetical protein WCT17_01935 [Bacilli bacterium]
MRKFWILFKVNVQNTFSLNLLKKKFGNKSGFLRIGMPLITIFLGLLFLGIAFFYIAMYSQVFVMAGQYEGILYLGLGLAGVMMLLTTISKAHSYLFESKDFDLLMSLPIPPRSIIASKISQLLLLNYFSLVYLFVPSIILYGIYTTPSLLFYVGALGVFIAFPFLIVTICSAISYGLNILLSRIKRKNIFQVIFMILFFIAVMVGSTSLSSSMAVLEGNDMDMIIAMSESIQRIMKILYYPGTLVVKGLTGSIVHYLLYVGISILPFLGFLVIVGRGFVKAQSRSKMTYTDKNFVLKEAEVTTPVKAVFIKEIKLLFSNASVFLNTAIGPIMSTFMLVFYLFTQEELFTQLGGTLDPGIMIGLLIAIVTVMGTMITTTASSISLEGKQFWIVKVAPVAPTSIFKAKVLVNFILVIPTTIINSVVVAIVFKPNLFLMAMFIIIPLIVNLLIGSLGLFINLLFPKLNWDNPLKAVKQGMSVVLTMFASLIVSAVLVVVFVLTSPLVGSDVSFLLVILISGLGLTGVIWLLKTVGVKRYHSIPA